MKFQNLKLEKERQRQRNLRSKNNNVLRRKRVPSAWWATNDVDNGLRLLESDYLRDSGLRFCFSTRLRLLESEWVRWVSEWVSLNFEDFVMSRLKVLWICFYSADFESCKLNFYVAPRGNFFQLRVSQKHWTQDLETRVLIKSRVLKTRDASFTHTFKTGQLTKLLEYYCYLERVFIPIQPKPLYSFILHQF